MLPGPVIITLQQVVQKVGAVLKVEEEGEGKEELVAKNIAEQNGAEEEPLVENANQMIL